MTESSEQAIYELTGRIIHETIGTAPIVEHVERGEQVGLFQNAAEATFQFLCPNVMRMAREVQAKDSPQPSQDDLTRAYLLDIGSNVLAILITFADNSLTLPTKLCLNAISSIAMNVPRK